MSHKKLKSKIKGRARITNGSNSATFFTEDEHKFIVEPKGRKLKVRELKIIERKDDNFYFEAKVLPKSEVTVSKGGTGMVEGYFNPVIRVGMVWEQTT